MKLGILGGGQLGRMLALAGYPLGVQTTVLEPAEHSSAALVCNRIAGDFDDYRALYELARSSDVVTFEFENVPVQAVRWLAERVPVFPSALALEVSQERLAEKQFFESLGIPTPEFVAVESEADYRSAVASIGLPGVLKTRRFGYDGKGQFVLRTKADVEAAWLRLGGRPLIFEQFVSFDRELSVIAVRSRAGEIVAYPLIENTHLDGILHRSIAPATNTGEELSERAAEFAGMILRKLDYVGVLAVEFFQEGARLLANEMAPRVHNSGHWTIEGARTSQFENHVRAVMGLPLGSAEPSGYSAMYNLIGALPPIAGVLSNRAAHLHCYGKEGRPGRKVGHVTLTMATVDELQDSLPEWEEQYRRAE